MKNNKWDRNDWQGRRKDQVDSTNLIVWISMAVIALTLFFTFLKYVADHAHFYIK